MQLARFNDVRLGNRITLPGLLLFLLALLLLTALLIWSDATRKVDRLLYDSWVRYDQRDVPGDVVIAAIDTESLNELGRWPWPRDIQAQLLERLAEYGARAVVIDLLYTEASADRDVDLRLGEAIGNLPLSVLPVLIESNSGRVSFESLPIPDLTRKTGNLGHVSLPIDDDGIVRRVHLEVGINQAHWPSLALALLDLLDQRPDPLPGAVVPVNKSSGRWLHSHEVYIPFYGANGAFPRISAADIIRKVVPDALLRNQIVFIGMTTTGLGDVVPTPVSALGQPVPGVEIHANVFSALRDGSVVTRANPYIALLIAMVVFPLMLLLYSRAPPEWGVVTAVFGSILPIVVSFLLYKYWNLWSAPLSVSVTILISNMLWSRHRLTFVNQFLEREQAVTAEYLPKRVVSDNSALERFFTSASRHLPIDAWRFTVGREQYSGRGDLPSKLPAVSDGRWAVHDGVYVRRYSAGQGLLIEMRVTDEVIGPQIADYIDSLARVRDREQATLLSGSIERLQSNVLSVNEQLEWLRSVKVFSDTVISAAPAGFSVWNPAGECIRANTLLHRLIEGYRERGDLLEFICCVGRDPSHGEDAVHFENLIQQRVEWQFASRENERELVVHFRAVGEQLAERLICVTVMDLTDIRTAEKARAEMVDYLSHDLRSPLISALYLAESEADPRIASNIQNSLAMMDDLLHIARADDLSEKQFEPLLLNAVLDNTLDQLSPQARQQGITFAIDTIDEDLWVVGDAASLERAFVNIVGNAIKYSPQGTVITVTLACEGAQAKLTIDDQGVGISPDQLDQLFTRFKRDSATAGEHTGIGLGLALVSKVVSLHGGRVSASNLDIGTRVLLELPLEEQVMQVEEQPGAALDYTENRRLSG